MYPERPERKVTQQTGNMGNTANSRAGLPSAALMLLMKLPVALVKSANNQLIHEHVPDAIVDLLKRDSLVG